MKNKSSELPMKLNQFADVLVLKSLKCASQNNSNGEEMKTKPYKIFSSFFIGTNVYKNIKYKQFRCNFEDKVNKQKGL